MPNYLFDPKLKAVANSCIFFFSRVTWNTHSTVFTQRAGTQHAAVSRQQQKTLVFSTTTTNFFSFFFFFAQKTLCWNNWHHHKLEYCKTRISSYSREFSALMMSMILLRQQHNNMIQIQHTEKPSLFSIIIFSPRFFQEVMKISLEYFAILCYSKISHHNNCVFCEDRFYI